MPRWRRRCTGTHRGRRCSAAAGAALITVADADKPQTGLSRELPRSRVPPLCDGGTGAISRQHGLPVTAPGKLQDSVRDILDLIWRATAFIWINTPSRKSLHPPRRAGHRSSAAVEAACVSDLVCHRGGAHRVIAAQTFFLDRSPPPVTIQRRCCRRRRRRWIISAGAEPPMAAKRARAMTSFESLPVPS